MRQRVFADDHNLENARQHDLLVDVVGDALKTGQSDDILSHCHSQLIPLHFSLLPILVRRQVLQTHPKPIHFTHVLQDEFNRVIDIASLSLVLVALVWQDVLHHLEQVVAEK